MSPCMYQFSKAAFNPRMKIWPSGLVHAVQCFSAAQVTSFTKHLRLRQRSALSESRAPIARRPLPDAICSLDYRGVPELEVINVGPRRLKLTLGTQTDGFDSLLDV